MARQSVRVTRKTKSRVKKGAKGGYKKCNICHGTGRVKA